MQCTKCDRCGKVVDGNVWDGGAVGWLDADFTLINSDIRKVLRVQYCPECRDEIFDRLHIREEDFSDRN